MNESLHVLYNFQSSQTVLENIWRPLNDVHVNITLLDSV